MNANVNALTVTRSLLALAVALLALAGCTATTDLTEAGRFYQCTYPGKEGECPGGWHCGKEGYCHPTDAGIPWQCEGDVDCDDGWRCGLEGRCHDRRVASAYTCKVDPDCEQGWRCGPGDRCVDPSADALVPGRFEAPTVQRLNPRRLTGVPEKLAISPFFNSYFESFDVAAAFVTDDTLVYQRRVGLPDGFPMLPRHATFEATAQVPSGSIAFLAVNGSRTYAFGPGGNGVELQWTPDGGVTRPVSYPFAPKDVMVIREQEDEDFPPLRVAHDDSRYQLDLVGGTGESSGPKTLPAGSGKILDISTAFAPAWLLAATRDGGVYYARRHEPEGFVDPDDNARGLVDPNWSRYGQVPYLYDGGTLPLTVDKLHPFRIPSGSDLLVVESTASGGTPRYVSAMEMTEDIYDALLILDPRIEPFVVPCAPGDRLADIDVIGDFDYSRLELRCEHVGADGGTWSVLRYDCDAYAQGGCQALGTAEEPAQLRAHAPRGSASWVDRYGRLYIDWAESPRWYKPDPFERYAITLDRGVTSVFGTRDRLEALSPRTLALTTSEWPVERFVLGPAGIVSLREPDRVIWNGSAYEVGDVGSGDPVSGDENWVVRQRDGGFPFVTVDVPKGGMDAGIDGGIIERTVATVPGIPDLALGPFGGALTTGGAANADVLVVSAFDSLLAGDVSAQREDVHSKVTKLDIRATPFVRTPITSFAVVPPAARAEGVYLSGFALAGDHLVGFRATSATHWLTQELPLPINSEPLEVWVDGQRGRVGMRDGRVYAAASGVQIAPVLPELNPTVGDYAQICGQAFALGREGLYRLVPGTGPIGQWQRDDTLTAALPGPVGDKALEGGRLYAVDDTLHVFSSVGGVIRAQVAGCH